MMATLRDTARGYAVLSRYELRSFFPKLRPMQRPAPRHVLLLAPFLPPYDNGGVHRPLSWLQYAATNGWAASALTRPFVGSASVLGTYLSGRMPSAVKVALMRNLDIAPSWSLFPRIDGTFLGALGTIPVAEELIENSAVSAVAATGPSFDLFVSAFYLARMYRLPLVLDYRDEWTENPFGIVRPGNSDRLWERRCLKAAHLVIFTTESMKTHCQKSFPGVLQDKAFVLPNGWEPQDSTPARPELELPASHQRHRPMQIVFAGTMGDATLPGAFLDDVKSLFAQQTHWQKDLQIEFIGTRVPRAEAQIAAFCHQSNIAAKGNYPKDVANRIIRSSSILLLLTPTGMERYIPAKLFEYLASGKPVFVHGAAGEASRIVTRLRAGFFLPAGDPSALAEALEQVRTLPGERWNPPERQAWVEEHKREVLARRFFTMLDNLVQ